MWEDARNCKGGRWTCNLDRKSPSGPAADNRWLDLLMVLIGDTVHDDYGHMVNGAVINIRKHFERTSIWLNNSTHAEGINAIGR